MKLNPLTLRAIALSLLASVSTASALDNYIVDPLHTRVGFAARHFGINMVRGVFKEFTGKVVMDGNKVKEATAVIQVNSIDTGVAKRDEHLRSADFFDAANHPTITFKSKGVEPKGDKVVLIGDFTMRGTTKELALPVTLSKPIKDPSGKIRIGLEAKAKLNRKDYGIKYNEKLESGVAAVGDEIEIEINAEGIRDEPAK